MKKLCAIILVLCTLLLCSCSGEQQTTSGETNTPSKIEEIQETEPQNTIEKLETEAPETEKPTVLDNAVDPEFKALMDSYEDFFEEYCAFLKKYAENPSDLSLLMDYANFMTKYAETMGNLEALGDTDMTSAELIYYLEVYGRITEMLIDAM